ncbi:hypothetical protein [Psychromonas ossibalaenae]|uniref:hypothetical protein n=1 Tax=Psychromonas ossibalaenae TaxID=444922 RepID=UPI000372A5CF|nr:hypothetical protein [Psychromonas ossibalaenae]
MKIYLAALLFLVSFTTQASQRAVTEEGNIVILNDNGTWVYETPDAVYGSEIPTNKQKFVKPEESTFKVKSTRNDSGVWLDAKSWGFNKTSSNSDAEYQFQLKGEDLYGMLIPERIEIRLEALAKIALDNAKLAASNIKRTKIEYRDVNGLKVIYMEMQGTMQGIDVTYAGYYYSNKTGSTQLVTWTGTTLFEKYESEVHNFLNGFVGQ